MALVVLVSAKGAPGVTSLTVALAALSPGGVAADLDPDGGDLALRYRRVDGAPLDPDRGLLSLAASLRREPSDFVGSGPIYDHLQVTAGGLEVLLGVKGPDQAIGLGPLWSPLARALAEANRSVFADCGRIGPASPAMPALMVADAVIMVARPELEELAHLRERLRFLTATLPSRYSGRARVGVILVAAERDRAAGPRTEQLLRSSGVAVSVLGTVADDTRGAAKLRGMGSGDAGRTTLIRSVRSLLPAIRVFAGDVPEVAQLRAEAAPSPALAAPPVAVPDPATAPSSPAGPPDPAAAAVWGMPPEPTARPSRRSRSETSRPPAVPTPYLTEAAPAIPVLPPPQGDAVDPDVPTDEVAPAVHVALAGQVTPAAQAVPEAEESPGADDVSVSEEPHEPSEPDVPEHRQKQNGSIVRGPLGWPGTPAIPLAQQAPQAPDPRELRQAKDAELPVAVAAQQNGGE
jgi:hypothetical protein